jgi:hypothetical protein
MNDAKLIELAEDVAGLKVGMASIEDKLDDLIHKLLGNGQPGVIADLQKSDRALAGRMDKVEKRNQWLAGVWVGVSSVVVGLFALIRYIFHR